MIPAVRIVECDIPADQTIAEYKALRRKSPKKLHNLLVFVLKGLRS